MPSRSHLVSLLLVVVLVAASCAGGDEEGSSGSPDTGRPGTTEPAIAPARPSPGCDVPPAEAVVEVERTLTVEGTPRRYLVTVPDGDAPEPMPLVFDVHGLMEGAEIHSQMTQYSTLAQEEGFVVVFPHGTGDPVRWEIGAEPNPDLAYFDAVLDEVAATTCIDEARVYATGLSNGAMFTTELLCHRADVLAAVAPVAGLLDPEDCPQAEPVPVLTFHGTDDPILLFNGGIDVSAIPGMEPAEGPTTTRPPADLDGEGYPAQAAATAERNGCAAEFTDTEVSAEVIHRVWDCPAGADVEMYIVVGGGHSWPGSEFSANISEIVGPTTFDVDATRDAWDFMSRFSDR